MPSKRETSQPYPFKTGDRVYVIGDDEMNEGRVRVVDRIDDVIEVAWRGRIRTWHKTSDLHHLGKN